MKIRPITILRDTNKLSEEVHGDNEPIFITKNGYGDLVIMSELTYDKITRRQEDRLHNSGHIYTNKLDSELKPVQGFGFVRVAAITPKCLVGNINFNIDELEKDIKEAFNKGAKVIVTPELSITSYTCQDLFLQEQLLNKAIDGLFSLMKRLETIDSLVFVGMPIRKNNVLYNTAVCFYKGTILGIVPKTYIPNYSEFYEKRYFERAPIGNGTIILRDKEYPFGTNLLFVHASYPSLKVAAEICEDLWAPISPSASHSLNGATMIVNLSASNEYVGKKNYRHDLVNGASARLCVSYVYASSGIDESTTDLIYSGHRIISSNGHLLGESPLFDNGITYAEVDIERLVNDRMKNTTFENREDGYVTIFFNSELPQLELELVPPMHPFLIEEGEDKSRYLEIIMMQAMGLRKRLEAIHCKKAVIGLSGGLDSALAVLVVKEAFQKIGLNSKDITCITMPCFGTSKRTYENALKLANGLDITLKEINISESVKQHFKDIGQDPNQFDVTFENCQARERTQVLMDYANRIGAIVIGTGDLSELVLGWCTYNGDHMSMYGVNSSIPKTLVQELVRAYAEAHEEVKDVLMDIVNTPISPELVPIRDGKIQDTEKNVGPYELNDYFMYYYLRHHFTYEKILYLAKQSFKGKYEESTIEGWLKLFFKRFFSSQFKRSCLPDGVKVGTVAISPRGDLRMSSDSSSSFIFEKIKD